MQPTETPSHPPAHEGSGPPEPPVRVGELLTRLGPTGILAIVALAVPPLAGFALIYYMKSVGEWLKAHQFTGLAIYSLGFAVLSGLSLLPTYAQAALGGFAFGIVWGLPGALLGFIGGSFIGYIVAKRTSGDRVQNILKEHPKWLAVRNALVADHTRNSFWKTTGMVALVRLPPNSPFAITNIVMASVQVPMTSFLLGTVLGMLPRTAVVAWIGATVGFTERGDFAYPKWLWITGIVLTLIVLFIIMQIADRALKRTLTKSTATTTSSTAPVPDR